MKLPALPPNKDKKERAASLLNREVEYDIIREIHRRSYYEFYKKAFTILNPGEPFNDNWHLEYLCNRLQDELARVNKQQSREQDIIINVPFRSSKSLIVSVIFPVWAWIIRPSTKFICVSFSNDLALELATLSRNLLTSEWFTDIYGDKYHPTMDENTKGFFKNKFSGFRKSVGTGGQVTGSGADFILLDDAQNPKKAASEVERKNTINFYEQTLYSRLNQPEIGVRINIQQRLHENDLTGHLVKKAADDYELIKIPAEVTPNDLPSPPSLVSYYKDNLFWPSRFSKAQLLSYERILGSYGAAGQLQQRPAPAEGGLVRREWFIEIDPITLQRDLTEHPINFYIDAGDLKDENAQNSDFLGILAAYKKDNHVFIVDVSQVKMEFFELCKFIPKYVTKHYYTNNSKIKIEPKSSGRSIVSQLKSTTMLNVVELKAPKDDKITRLMAIQPLLESGRVRLLKGSYVKDFLDQLCMFPNAQNDDMVDVLMYAVSDMLQESDFDFTFM